MKRLSLIVVVALLAFAANADTKKASKKEHKGLIGHSVEKADKGYYGMSGCGLGSILFGETESKGGQVLAATTNGVYSNNTFGMSSGTSNCVQDSSSNSAAVKKNVQLFVAANREALANDVVKSNGETIATVSEIMGCSDTDYLGAKLQSRYETIFSSKEDGKVADSMFETVATDRYLAENCNI